jgi:stearoyl-CoA desaturase (Delta-9 desaturase)
MIGPLALVLGFTAGYLVSGVYISVFYHRALAHRSLLLHPRLLRFVLKTGVWVTGIDAKGWVVMHRLHHRHADTHLDPHSPHQVGILGVPLAQLRSYRWVLRGLIAGSKNYLAIGRDLPFEVSWTNRRGLWYAPYVAQLLFVLGLGAAAGAPGVGLGVFLGLASHPLQGWLVNALGHAWGYRSFDGPDRSTNNLLVAGLVLGEGLQNNHHHNPGSARFAVRWWEPDLGYAVCRLLQAVGGLTIPDASASSGGGPATIDDQAMANHERRAG